MEPGYLSSFHPPRYPVRTNDYPTFRDEKTGLWIFQNSREGQEGCQFGRAMVGWFTFAEMRGKMPRRGLLVALIKYTTKWDLIFCLYESFHIHAFLSHTTCPDSWERKCGHWNKKSLAARC